MPTANEIRRILTEKLDAAHIEIIDDSHRHAGHAGAKQGGHFTVKIVSNDFDGKSLTVRHKLVYAALDSLMKAKIHALTLKTLTPTEFKSFNV